MANLSPSSIAVSFVESVASLLELLIGLRFTLKLFSANPTTPFVEWIYHTSEPFLNPFQNIFPSIPLDHNYTIESSTLFAIIIYAVAGYLISNILLSLDRNLQSILTKTKLTTAQKQYQKNSKPPNSR